MSYFGNKDWYAEVLKGKIPGHRIVHKYGRNPNGSISTEATITGLGQINFLSAATTVRVKAGGNAADTAAGAGAREVTIEGVDESGLFATEAVATAGASASSATTTTFFRVFRAYVSSQGTYPTTGTATTGSNQGAITIENSAGGTDLIQIAQYEGQSEYAGYAIPSDETGYILSTNITLSGVKEADVLMYTRDNYLTTSAPVAARRLKLYFDGVVGQAFFKPTSPIEIGSECDVWWNFIPTANGTECSVDFELLLVKNTLL